MSLGGGLGVISAVILKDYKFLSPAIGTSIQVMINDEERRCYLHTMYRFDAL